MPKSKLTMGIELAGEEIRLTVLELPEGESSAPSLHLARTVRTTEELARTVRALPRRPSAVTCAIPLEGAAVRILSLPPTTEDNLERVVNLEAEGAMPITGEELALSHHVLGMNDQSRLEVLVAAARLSLVQEALRRVNCLPWLSAQVTVTAAALVNVIETLAPSQREETCAILRVERDSSELIVLEKGRIVITQYLAVGCGAAGAVPEPAQVPVGVGSGVGGGVGGGGLAGAGSVVPSASAWVASVAQPVRFALQALAYERGLTVRQLYLCGEGSTRGGAEGQLSDRLDVTPVLLGPAVPATSGQNDQSGVYAVAYGCALQAAGLAAMPLNLTPARVAVAREIEQRRQTRISWGALVGAVVISAVLILVGAISQKQRTLKELDANLAKLSGISIDTSMSPGDLKKADEAIEAHQLTRVPASQLISTLSQTLPRGTWLGELNYKSATGCSIRGYALDRSGPQSAVIAMLNQRLFDGVTLDYTNSETVNNVEVWGFQLTCKLRPPEAPKRSRTRAPARGGQAR